MEVTGLLSDRQKKDQFLDKMELERERGITIKAQTVAIQYMAKDGTEYLLNLIDTPGHVDFTYEVSRSLSSCEGALLVVDATQGVEAQTLSNVYLALEQDLELIPVLNKVDLPSADPDKVLEQIEDGIGLDTENAIVCSAKTGLGVNDVVEAIVQYVPPPTGDRESRLKALIVDSWFDTYVGVIILVRVVDGVLRKGDRFVLMATGATYEVNRIGVFSPDMKDQDALWAEKPDMSLPRSSSWPMPAWAIR